MRQSTGARAEEIFRTYACPPVLRSNFAHEASQRAFDGAFQIALLLIVMAYAHWRPVKLDYPVGGAFIALLSCGSFYSFVRAFLAYVRHKKFGEVVLACHQEPKLGTTLWCTIRFSRGVSEGSKITTTVTALRYRRTYRSLERGGDGHRGRRTRRVLWRDGVSTAACAEATGHDPSITTKCAFPLPKAIRGWMEEERPQQWCTWGFRIEAEVPGINLKAELIIPAQAPLS